MLPINLQSDMLRAFLAEVRAYQPEGLEPETGEPQTALSNINRLRSQGLVIAQIRVRPTGALVIFSTGEQFYTPALRVGGDGRETEILAEIAAEAGWGDLEELLDCYHAIDPAYEGPLPDLLPDDVPLTCPLPNCPLRHPRHKPRSPHEDCPAPKLP